jgi:hypothetical protein
MPQEYGSLFTGTGLVFIQAISASASPSALIQAVPNVCIQAGEMSG